MGSAFDPDTFDPANPAAFYLEAEELAEFADSVWVVQGTELPVNIGVVVHRSAVLRGAYKAERESAALQASRRAAQPYLPPPGLRCMPSLLRAASPVAQDTAPGGRKRTRQAAAEAGPPRVRLAIEGCSVKEAALFLRFLYHTHEITPAAMGKLGLELPGVSPA